MVLPQYNTFCVEQREAQSECPERALGKTSSHKNDLDLLIRSAKQSEWALSK